MKRSSLIQRCLALHVALLFLGGVTGSAGAQCTVQQLNQWGANCGSGFHKGQSFIMPQDGRVTSIQLHTCDGLESTLVLRAFNGQTDQTWNDGALIATAAETFPAAGVLDDCNTNVNGFASYTSKTFTFDDVALIGGTTYIFELTTGAGATGCGSYADGDAYAPGGINASFDLPFLLEYCPGSIVIGCMDPSACNYDPAAEASNGSCTYPDYALDCDGNCLNDDDNNGICNEFEVGGCTDNTKCNYDAQATFDDGSCAELDCHGTCGGTALVDADCGCIGGETGIPVNSCTQGCTTDFIYHFPESLTGGLRRGQSFTAAVSGSLLRVDLLVCRGLESALNLRSPGPNNASNWNEGTLLSTSTTVVPANTTADQCNVSSFGFGSYEVHSFEFSDVGVVAGETYVLELASGVAAAQVADPYSGGMSFVQTGGEGSIDLSFGVYICEGPVTLGCTDDSACNYDASSNVEDGSCLYLDCQGTCGGSAYLDPICGCLDSQAEAGSCTGCLDPASCNYDAEATVDDGSCATLDCEGNCGGNAVITSCGCAGGNTGINPAHCVDGCITDPLGSTATACGPGLLIGQRFTAATSGELKQVHMRVCCASDAVLELREMSDDPCGSSTGWNQGNLLYTSSTLSATCSGLSECLTSGGTDGYVERTFDMGGILQAGRDYVLHLSSGYAVASCSPHISSGYAYNGAGAMTGFDVSCELFICSDNIVWGCTDASACSGYDPSATHDDGSCVFSDCHGDCGGTALDDAECGCIGGNTGIREQQCSDGVLLSAQAYDPPVCINTASGQTFSSEQDGFMKGFHVFAENDEVLEAELQIADGPQAGTSIGTVTSPALPDECGQSYTLWRKLDFGELPIQLNRQYILMLHQGEARLTCSAQYTNGTALTSGSFTPISNGDLSFRMIYRAPAPGELVWGCMDPSACNYDATATHDDGSCTSLDCHGDCGGSAYVIADCGCVEGNTGVAAGSCYGCTNPVACNYDAGASIDDGSCGVFDCNGDCGGSAINHPECGCIGGNTNVDPGTCLDKCQGVLSINLLDPAAPQSGAALGGSGQTFTLTETAFLTALRFAQNFEPPGSLTVELRAVDAPDVHEGTLLASETHDTWSAGDNTVFLEWDNPVILQANTPYALVLLGAGWSVPKHTGDIYADGGSFTSSEETAAGADLLLDIYTCTDLRGCTSSSACNYEDWATEDNGTCYYAPLGVDCDGFACAQDADGDGICAQYDIDDNDPSVCIDSDEDGCDDCSSGSFNLLTDGPDVDGDGICDGSDLCEDPAADNYDDPANEVCRGLCDNAPIFEGVTSGVLPSGPNNADGTLELLLSYGSLPYEPQSAFEAATLQLEGVNGSPDYLIDLLNEPLLIAPGTYVVTVYNAEGCQGVAAAPGGTTFGQAPVEHTVRLNYRLCCGGCGVYDSDTDGICDDIDLCTDKTSNVYNDPNNIPCE